jgi:hypothetical protein
MDKQPEQEEKPIGENLMNFGRYKGKTYDEIYENHKEYVKWIITTKDSEKYVKKIKGYFVERIQEDYPEE